MNLNFYNPNSTGSLENLHASLQEQLNKLDQLKNLNLQTPAKEQRYVLDCGNQEDWKQFLQINYNLTEEQMFSDYKIFLQAKAEMNEDQNKDKLEEMKRKISAPKIKEKGNAQYLQSNSNQQQSIQSVPSHGEPIRQEQMVPIQSNFGTANNQSEYTNNTPNQNGIIIDARANVPSTNQLVKPINSEQLGKDTNSHKEKGVQHVW